MVGEQQKAKRAVAVFSTSFLQYSQTFIYQELLNHQRYRAEVFCHDLRNAAQFPFDPVHALSDLPGVRGRVEAGLYKLTTLSPTFGRLLSSGNYDLLHAHFGPGSVYALPYAAALDLPLIVTVHGYDVPVLLSASRFAPRYWRYWAASKWMLRSVSRFLAASEELAELLLRLGVPSTRIRVAPVGIELPVERTESRDDRVIMVGRFVEKKGFEYGIEAFARIAHSHPNAQLTIVGDGPRKNRYRQLTERLGIADRVCFLGALDHDRTLDEIGRSALLMAPSVTASDGNRESGLVVVKEAAARWVPAVSTRHGGIPQIVDHGETGCLVEERAVEDLAAHLDRLLADGALRCRMGDAARAKMEREYAIADRVAALEQHYDEVIAERV